MPSNIIKCHKSESSGTSKTLRFIDLFCGIGGFHIACCNAAKSMGLEARCVFASDIDRECQITYRENFGMLPHGDITTIEASTIPDHDILLAGFPCQPFSIIGHRKGFSDTRGTLFFDIARILETKQPSCFVLENVKLLAGHNNGKTIQRILSVLKSLGYFVHYKILNALDFGLPQKRERIFIVGSRENDLQFEWPTKSPKQTSLDDILESDVGDEYYASEYIRMKREKAGILQNKTTIWHENKSGHISAYPYSCALRAGASYNYLLVNGERRLTGREMLRLQGFPDTFRTEGSYSTIRKQAGNSLPVPVAESVIYHLLRQAKSLAITDKHRYGEPNECVDFGQQMRLLEKRRKYLGHAKNKDR